MELLGIYFGLGALWKTTKILKNLWTKQVWDSLLWNNTVSLERTSLFCIFFSQMWKLRLRESNWFIQDQRLIKWENQNSNLSLPCSYSELVSLQKSHMIYALIKSLLCLESYRKVTLLFWSASLQYCLQLHYWLFLLSPVSFISPSPLNPSITHGSVHFLS